MKPGGRAGWRAGRSGGRTASARLDTNLPGYMMPVSWEGTSVWWIAMEVEAHQ